MGPAPLAFNEVVEEAQGERRDQKTEADDGEHAGARDGGGERPLQGDQALPEREEVGEAAAQLADRQGHQAYRARGGAGQGDPAEREAEGAQGERQERDAAGGRGEAGGERRPAPESGGTAGPRRSR